MKVGRLKRKKKKGKVVAPYPYTYIHEVNYQQPDPTTITTQIIRIEFLPTLDVSSIN